MIHKKTFTQADLNGSNQLVYNHTLGTSDIIASWIDETGAQRLTADAFTIVSISQVILSCGDAITGSHKLLMYYDTVAESTSGRKAFELTENNNPDDAMRLIGGKAATPSFNITLANFYTLLLGKLSFLKKSENLNDLPDLATARGNLGVYSTTDIDLALNGKATLFQAGSGAVLGVNNTANYTPSSANNPATKGYVDGIILASGNEVLGNLPGTVTEFTIPIGKVLADTNYVILGAIVSVSGEAIFYTRTKGTSTFTIIVRPWDGSASENINFDWVLIKKGV